MNKNLAISFAVVTLVTLGSIITYTNFTNTSSFNFTNLNQPKVVKGVSTSNSSTGASSFFTPTPSNSIALSVDASSTTKSQVLESTFAYDRIVSFYKNFFVAEDWYITDESDTDRFYNLELERDGKKIKITLSKTESDTTLISIQETL